MQQPAKLFLLYRENNFEMSTETKKWRLKPSREGQVANRKALYNDKLTQEEIQSLKNKGYASWFMEVVEPIVVAEPIEAAPVVRNKVRSGVEALTPPTDTTQE